MAGTPYARCLMRTAVVYRTWVYPIATPPLSLYRVTCNLAKRLTLCYNPGPEAQGVGVPAPVQYKSHQSIPLNATVEHQIKPTTPLPYFGIDRMWDFGQVGAAS